MRTIERMQVPSNIEEDCNKENTTWKDGLCVRMNEGKNSLVFFGHETAESLDEEGNPIKNTTAYFFRIPNPATDEEALNYAKSLVKANIREYDASSKVNRFYIQGMPMWLDKTTRTGLYLRLQAEKEAEKTMTTLWYENHEVNLLVVSAIQMLNKLELYASECYDTTQEHLYKVSSLQDLTEIANYDYQTNYPEILHF